MLLDPGLGRAARLRRRSRLGPQTLADQQVSPSDAWVLIVMTGARGPRFKSPKNQVFSTSALGF
jgi:hypothetical protein